MAFQEEVNALEQEKQTEILRGKRAQVTQERYKADREEVKSERYSVQLQTERIKLQQDEVMQQGEEKVLELKQVALESVTADVDFARQKLALKRQRYDYELVSLETEVQQRLKESYEAIDAVSL